MAWQFNKTYIQIWNYFVCYSLNYYLTLFQILFHYFNFTATLRTLFTTFTFRRVDDFGLVESASFCRICIQNFTAYICILNGRKRSYNLSSNFGIPFKIFCKHYNGFTTLMYVCMYHICMYIVQHIFKFLLILLSRFSAIKSDLYC